MQYDQTPVNEYSDAALKSLTEGELQDYITDVYRKPRYNVRNIHRVNPGEEKGADLEVITDPRKILIATKVAPKKSDIPQMMKLLKRKGEGDLIYAHSKQATEPFEREARKVAEVIHFLRGNDLHAFLIKGECVGYMNRIFENHPLVKEYSDCISLIWTCRKNASASKSRDLDRMYLWRLKDAVVKKRGAVGVIALHYDRLINSAFRKRPEDLPQLVDKVLNDLDAVQTFTGTSLHDKFSQTAKEAPHILGSMWKKLVPRTYWNVFASVVGGYNRPEEVSWYASRFWVLPGPRSIGEAGHLHGGSLGILSGVRDTLESLSRSFHDLDEVIDWARETV